MLRTTWDFRWGLALGAVLAVGGLNPAMAFLPNLPPYLPPPEHHQPPPVITPPPIHNPPPPVHHSPEPASFVIGAIGAGIGGIVARRRKQKTSA